MEGRVEGCVLLAAPPRPYRDTGRPEAVEKALLGSIDREEENGAFFDAIIRTHGAINHCMLFHIVVVVDLVFIIVVVAPILDA